MEKEINQNVNIKKVKEKLPFVVFVYPKTQNEETENYKQIFTDIISERIQEEYK